MLILQSFSVFKLLMIIKKKLELQDSQTLYLYYGNILLTSDQTLENAYENYSNGDDFLYLTYC